MLKINKFIIVGIFLLAIITLGTISATDEVDALMVSGDTGDALGTPVDESDIVTSDDESEIVALDDEREIEGDGENKYNVTMDVKRPDDAYLNDYIYISVSVEANSTETEKIPQGHVGLLVNDNPVAIEEVNQSGFNYEIDDFGVYKFIVVYTGDDNFNGAVEEFTYNVSNSKYFISIDNEVEYGAEYFNVNAPVLNPVNIVITINGKKFNVFVDEDSSKNRCNASALSYGLNSVNVYYPGDEKFAEYSADENITAISSIGSYDGSCVYGESLDINITLPSPVAGTITAYSRHLDENESRYIYTKIASASVKDGVSVLSLNDLPVGSYGLYVNFTGSVEVNPGIIRLHVAPLITVPSSIKMAEDAYVDFKASEGSVKYIDVYYKNSADYESEDYNLLGSADVVNGQAKVSLSGLDEGFYDLAVVYYYVDGGSDLAEFSFYVVDESDITLNITACWDVLISEDYGSVEFSIPEYADGSVSIYIDGKKVNSLYMEDVGVIFEVSGLSLGKHSLSVNFTSAKGSASDSTEFSVVPARVYIPDKINVNDKEMFSNTIMVEVHRNATGSAALFIDNKLYQVQRVDVKADGRNYFMLYLTGISIGKHNVTVIYSDDKYSSFSRSKEINFGYDININCECIYGQDNIITVVFPDDLRNGVLTVTVDGETFEEEKDSNQITINPSKLSLGNHTVVAKYSGDDFYPAEEFSKTFEIYASINYPTANIIMGDDKGISLILPEGAEGKLNVTIEKSDKDNEWEAYDSQLISFVDGKAYYSFSDMPLGEYHVIASYTGDDYKMPSKESFIDVESIDWSSKYLDLGENLTIRFVSQFTDSGKLHIVLYKIVNNTMNASINLVENFTLPIENGKATYAFKDLKMGNYRLSVVEEYANGTIKGFQGEHNFYVDAPTIDAYMGNFDLGQILPMVFNFPERATGKINVSVYKNFAKEGSDEYKNVEIPVSGKTTVDLNEMITDLGNYMVSLHYVGNYGEFISEYWLYTISNSSDADLKADASDINQGQVATVSIKINPFATGNVTVNGKKVDIKDGKGTYEISGLAVGNYSFVVEFAGDGYFAPSNATVSFKVNKYVAPKIKAANAKVLYSAKNKYSVTVYGTDGKLAKNVQVIFKIKGKQVAKTKTNSKGVARYTVTKVPGTYKITAVALSKSVTKKLTVKHIVNLKKVTVKKSAKKLVLKATLSKVNKKYLKNKKITFKFKSKKYTAKTNKKGVAKVTLKSSVLKKLKVGKKVTYQATYLKDTVKKTVKIKK